MYIYIYYIYVDLYIDVKQDGQISIGARDFGVNRVNQRPVRPRKTPNKNRSGTKISYINMGRCPISTWLTSDCVTPIYLYLDTSDNMVSHGITWYHMVSLYHFHQFPWYQWYHYIISIHFLYQPVIIKINEQSERPPHASPPSPATWPGKMGNGEDHVMWKHIMTSCTLTIIFDFNYI